MRDNFSGPDHVWKNTFLKDMLDVGKVPFSVSKFID